MGFPEVPVGEFKKVILTCKFCQSFLQVLLLQPARVNPGGLKNNALWQTDVIHFSTFGRLNYVFLWVDTYFHVCWASAHTREKGKHTKSH